MGWVALALDIIVIVLLVVLIKLTWRGVDGE